MPIHTKDVCTLWPIGELRTRIMQTALFHCPFLQYKGVQNNRLVILAFVHKSSHKLKVQCSFNKSQREHIYLIIKSLCKIAYVPSQMPQNKGFGWGGEVVVGTNYYLSTCIQWVVIKSLAYSPRCRVINYVPLEELLPILGIWPYNNISPYPIQDYLLSDLKPHP